MSVKKDCWVGFDLGGSKMAAAVYDHAFALKARSKRRTEGGKGTTKEGLERVVETIRMALKKADLKEGQLSGVGIACPGPLDLERGVLLESPNLGWTDAPLKETLEKAFKVPSVVLNDVDAGLFGEALFGAARGARCAVGIFPGTGIGGACVYEGRILRGRRMSCMEIGHIQVLPQGPLCGCGQRGCLETVAARLVIAQACAAAAFRGEAPALLALAGCDLAEIRSGVLAKAIEEGDKVVRDIVTEAARWIGIATAGIVNLLAPEVVVLGGGLVEAMPGIFKDEVERAASERVMPSFVGTFKVKVAQRGDDAALMGAAAWARQQGAAA